MKYKKERKALDNIIDEMIEVVENSRHEIFNISELASEEFNRLQKELTVIKEKVVKHIDADHQLAIKVRISRRRLLEASRRFGYYSEEELQEIYEQTNALQIQLAVHQKEEIVLKERRDELERRLITLKQTIERSENIAGKISVILPYLHDDFRQVNDLLESAKEKQKFSLEIIKAQENERHRISREIHDGPAQMLASIALHSELVDRAIRDQTTDQALLEIKEIRKMIELSLREVRRIIYDLRPMALDDLGLIPTMKKYVRNTAEYTKMAIEFIPIGEEKRLEQKYEITLFRVMQESLQNAIKHSECSRVTVKLEIGKDFLSLMIKDDGKGFDQTIKNDESFGLIGMKERVMMLGGELLIDSKRGSGTKIYVHIPCH